MNARMLYVHALSPIHVGMGQGVGVIDLPVIREAVTGWPYLPGSSIKGVLREASRGKVDDATITKVYGPDPKTGDPSAHAGGASFADQRLLFLPVRSYKGSFAWVTSPLALNRWARDCTQAGIGMPPAHVDVQSGQILLTAGAKEKIATGNDVYLEDLKLGVAEDARDVFEAIAAVIAAACFADDYWNGFFRGHAGVVSDTTFSFLTRTATEIIARNRIDDDRKIVATGALWWEEAVPAETIFAGPIVVTGNGVDGEALGEALATATAGTLQIGGNATVGRGLASARLDGGAA